MGDEKQLATTKSVDIESLIKLAVDKDLAIDKMERLLIMRRELKEEAAKDYFFSDLSGFQTECPVIAKEKEAMEKDGKKVRYKYATLDSIVSQVKPLLLKYGFSYTIQIEQDEKSVTAICIVHHKDGHDEKTSVKMPIDITAYMNALQKVASAITFAKRYAFCNAFGIMTGDEDDDANSAEDQDKLEQKQQPGQKPETTEKPVGKTIVPDKKTTQSSQGENSNSAEEKEIVKKPRQFDSWGKPVGEFLALTQNELEKIFTVCKISPAQKQATIEQLKKRQAEEPTLYRQQVDGYRELYHSIIKLDKLIMQLPIEHRQKWIDEKERCIKVSEYQEACILLEDELQMLAAPKVDYIEVDNPALKVNPHSEANTGLPNKIKVAVPLTEKKTGQQEAGQQDSNEDIF